MKHDLITGLRMTCFVPRIITLPVALTSCVVALYHACHPVIAPERASIRVALGYTARTLRALPIIPDRLAVLAASSARWI